MAGYAKVQKWCFYGGLLGFAIIVIILLVSSQFGLHLVVQHRERQAVRDEERYAAPRGRGDSKAVGVHAAAVRRAPGAFGQSLLLVPMLMFYLLWPNWGTTLYGEVRGASDFKRVFSGMFFGLWTTVLLSVVLLALFAKTFGYVVLPVRQRDVAPCTGSHGTRTADLPVPGAAGGWLVHNTAFQVILILLMSLWFFGWVGTLFLSSTRVIFAAAFDRILPDGAAAGVGEAPGAGVVAGADAAARGRAERAVLLQLDVPHLHAGRDAGDRGDVPVQRDRRGDPAVAQAGTVAGLAGLADSGYSACRWCRPPAWSPSG